MQPNRELADRIRSALANSGNPERALGQQRYMKSEMPYYGLTSPELKAVLNPFVANFRPDTRWAWESTVLDLWDNATHREERYSALTVARAKVAHQWYDPDALPLFRHLVVTGAWWDFVDVIAAHLVGEVLARHRDLVTPIMRAWSEQNELVEDLWVRRTAVLSQLRHKGSTDRALLHDVIENNLADTSFWLRKAIGWSLREFARTDPAWVLAEVESWGERLSGLSRREALKHLR